MSKKIYNEDGIEFELMKKTQSKNVAQAEKLKYKKQGYYSRVKHFYDKNGKVVFYGVIKSLKKKPHKKQTKSTNKKSMGIHPYSEFGFKPVKENIDKKYMYHAVCESKYKKELTEGIYPPVFIATTPKTAYEIVKRVHSCNPKILRVNISNLPIYKDLYWEMSEKEYEELDAMYGNADPENIPSDVVATFIMHDMNEDLRDLTTGNIFYIPKKITKSRLSSL